MDQLIKFISWFFCWVFRRPKLIIRISEDDPNREEGGLVFEVENQSSTLTSLTPTIDVAFVTINRHSAKMIFDVRELDKSLQPFIARSFSASARQTQPERFHGWFRAYTFRPSKGSATTVRLKNASLETIGLARFFVEKLLFKITGRVILGSTSMTIEQYRAGNRSRGTH